MHKKRQGCRSQYSYLYRKRRPCLYTLDNTPILNFCQFLFYRTKVTKALQYLPMIVILK